MSNRGRVYSYKGKGKYIKPRQHKSGHLYLRLFPGRMTKSVHSLVMLAFAGLPPEGQEVRHLNDIGNDNRWPENLAYGTQKQNVQDRKWNGIRSGASRLSPTDVMELKIWFRAGRNRKEIATLLGIHINTVYAIGRGDYHDDIT